MMYAFAIHYKLRKGLGPEWVSKTEEYAYDDLPQDVTFEDAREMARLDFKKTRLSKGTTDREYYITDIVAL